MEAIRKIMTVLDNTLKVVWPDHFNDRVELIMLPVEPMATLRVAAELSWMNPFER